MELCSRLPAPPVEQATGVIIDVVRQVVLTNENAVRPTPGGTSGVTSFSEKEGANVTAATSV